MYANAVPVIGTPSSICAIRQRASASASGTRLEAKGKREAQIACADLISRINTGLYLPPDKTTLVEFLERWLDSTRPNVAPRTHERYGEIVRKNIAPLLGSVILSKLKPAQISNAYATALSKGRRDGTGGLSPQTVQHMHRVLKQALKQAVRWELLHRNPADAVDAAQGRAAGDASL